MEYQLSFSLVSGIGFKRHAVMGEYEISTAQSLSYQFIKL